MQQNTPAAASAGVEEQYSIRQDEGGRAFVEADRNVLHGDNPTEWAKQLYDYINNQIRNGEDLVIQSEDGDQLTISEKTAWKMSDRHVPKTVGTKNRYMEDGVYRTKLNAAAHIDELAEVSQRGKKVVPDRKKHEFARDGFDYRIAYFRDFDGTMYRLTVSVGKNGTVNTIYNIGRIQRKSSPGASGLNPHGKAQAAKQSTSAENNSNIAQAETVVNPGIQEQQSKRTPTAIQAGANGTLTPVGGNEGSSNVNVPRKRQTVNPQTTETEEGPRYSRPVRDEAQLRQEMEQAREESRRLKEERDAWEDSQEVRELKERRLQMREHKAPLPGRERRRGGYRRLGGAAATTAPALWKPKATQTQQQADRKLTVSRGNNYLGGFAKHLQTVRAGK